MCVSIGYAIRLLENESLTIQIEVFLSVLFSARFLYRNIIFLPHSSYQGVKKLVGYLDSCLFLKIALYIGLETCPPSPPLLRSSHIFHLHHYITDPQSRSKLLSSGTTSVPKKTPQRPKDEAGSALYELFLMFRSFELLWFLF